MKVFQVCNGRSGRGNHVDRNRRLRDLDAELEQLATDLGGDSVGSDGDDLRRAPPQAPRAENTAEKQRVRQQMLARNWHDDAISSELGSFCQKSHLIAGLIDLS